MRRLALPLALIMSVVLAPPARAQTFSDVVLTLVRQDPWLTAKHHVISVAVRARNTGATTYHDLSLGLTVFAPVASRSAYEQSLQQDPSSVIDANAPPVTGPLRPGQGRTYLVHLDLKVLAQRKQTAIYPMRIDLRSSDQPIAVIRSPVLFFTKQDLRPKVPLDLSWTFVLHEPILFDPSGAFTSAAARELVAPGGRLRSEVDALATLEGGRSPVPLDLAVSPTLLLQLQRMRDGFRLREGATTTRVRSGNDGAADAAHVLAGLRRVARSPYVELSAMPFAWPSIPALIRSGLVADLPVQLARGRALARTALGIAPVATTLRPPGSYLDQAGLFGLAESGIQLLLPDPQVIAARPTQPNGFAQPPLVSLDAGAGLTMDAVVPDAGTTRLLLSGLAESDPLLASQAVLGELAQIWLEQPGTSRGVAVLLPDDMPAGPSLYPGLVHRLGHAPFLRKVRADTLAADFPPSGSPVGVVPRTGPTFPSSYVDDLHVTRGRISTLRSTLVQSDPLPRRLDDTLLLAESAQFGAQRTLGLAFLDGVRRIVDVEFEKVAPDTSRLVTLASRSGTLPVAILNASGHPVRVKVRLISPHLRFVHGATQTALVAGRSLTLTFGVETRTTGRFPVQVQVLSPNGVVLSQGQLVVRSTAYSRVALVITIGAALVLVALWARRFLPRTRR